MTQLISAKEKLIAKIQNSISRYEEKLQQTPFWDTKSKKYVQRKLSDLRSELSVQRSLLYRLKDSDD